MHNLYIQTQKLHVCVCVCVYDTYTLLLSLSQTARTQGWKCGKYRCSLQKKGKSKKDHTELSHCFSLKTVQECCTDIMIRIWFPSHFDEGHVGCNVRQHLSFFSWEECDQSREKVKGLPQPRGHTQGRDVASHLDDFAPELEWSCNTYNCIDWRQPLIWLVHGSNLHLWIHSDTSLTLFWAPLVRGKERNNCWLFFP